jgi:2'-5' RNA ligase
MPARRAAPTHVDRVHLIRSHIGPGGARYEELAAFPQ